MQEDTTATATVTEAAVEAPPETAAAPGAPALPADFEEQVSRILEKVRPFLQMDGGDLELVAIEDNNVLVRLHGACTHCSISDAHMKLGVEEAIRRDVEGFGELIVIE
jgi:Fe-S cluster biogenesis protein NfuA